MSIIKLLSSIILTPGSGANQVNIPQVSADSSSLHTILNILYGVIGAIAVLMATISALQFVLSRGEPQAAARARESLIYAAVGIAIIIAAFTITSFVYNSV